jgi:hypothetical protein
MTFRQQQPVISPVLNRRRRVPGHRPSGVIEGAAFNWHGPVRQRVLAAPDSSITIAASHKKRWQIELFLNLNWLSTPHSPAGQKAQAAQCEQRS